MTALTNTSKCNKTGMKLFCDCTSYSFLETMAHESLLTLVKQIHSTDITISF